MASPNYSDIAATTIEHRSRTIADNVTKNNALLSRLKRRGKVRKFSGGSKILEELSFQENPNGGWYSGYDTLPTAAADMISAAEYAIKQVAVPVTISGLEELQNSGKEKMIDLLEARLAVSEATMANLIAQGIYSDGTGSSGKTITGLAAAVPLDPTTGTYGGINRATWTFWRSKFLDSGALTAANIMAAFNLLWAQMVRGTDRPDLIPVDSNVWGAFQAAVQGLQSFTDPSEAEVGFPSLKYMGADVVLDGGIGGYAGAYQAYFLNTNYIHYRPHADRDMVPIGGKRLATNQDASVQILGWAGNLTCSGAQFQGRIDATP